MAAQTLYIVQQFEKQGRKLVAGRQMPYKTAAEAKGRADRDAGKYAGVVAVQTTVDTFSQPIEAKDCEAAVMAMADMIARGEIRPTDGAMVRLYDGFDVVAEVSIAGGA